MDKQDEIIFYIEQFLASDRGRRREDAMIWLDKLIELDPRCETPYKGFHYNYYYNRGVLYGYLGEDAKAIADYTKAIEINPNHDVAWGNRGVSYKILGDMPNAVRGVMKAVKVNPDSIHQINVPWAIEYCQQVVDQK